MPVGSVPRARRGLRSNSSERSTTRRALATFRWNDSRWKEEDGDMMFYIALLLQFVRDDGDYDEHTLHAPGAPHDRIA